MKTISWQIGRALSWTTASWVTLFGGVLALAGISLFLTNHDWCAVTVLTFSFLTDWWDGCVARYHQGDRPVMSRTQESELSLWQKLNYKGVTHFGRALDPLVDKIRFIGLLWVVGDKILEWQILFMLTLLAVILTLSRPIKRWLKLDHGGANQWGKYKVYAEVLLMIALVFGTRPLYGGTNPLADLSVTYWTIQVLTLATLALAFMSAWTHFESGYTHWALRRRS